MLPGDVLVDVDGTLCTGNTSEAAELLERAREQRTTCITVRRWAWRTTRQENPFPVCAEPHEASAAAAARSSNAQHQCQHRQQEPAAAMVGDANAS